MLIHTQENDLSIPDKLNWEVATRPLNFKSKGTFTFPKGILKDVPEDRYSCLVRDDTEEFISIVGSRSSASASSNDNGLTVPKTPKGIPIVCSLPGDIPIILVPN